MPAVNDSDEHKFPKRGSKLLLYEIPAVKTLLEFLKFGRLTQTEYHPTLQATIFLGAIIWREQELIIIQSEPLLGWIRDLDAPRKYRI